MINNALEFFKHKTNPSFYLLTHKSTYYYQHSQAHTYEYQPHNTNISIIKPIDTPPSKTHFRQSSFPSADIIVPRSGDNRTSSWGRCVKSLVYTNACLWLGKCMTWKLHTSYFITMQFIKYQTLLFQTIVSYIVFIISPLSANLYKWYIS